MVRLHQPMLLSVAIHLCRDTTDARDLVQDTLERALVGYGRRQPGSLVRPWLMAILRNRFIDSCRRRAGMKLSLGVGVEVTEEIICIPEPDPEPGWAGVTKAQVQEAVDSLSEEFRVVYQMHATDGRSYQEIAGQLGIAKATVGTRLLRARRKLRDALVQHLPPEEEGS